MKLFSKGDAIRSPEFHKMKERERWSKIVALTLFLLLFIVTPIYLFRMDQFQVGNIELKGNNVTQYEDIARIVTDNLNGNYLFLFPKSNALIYPKDKIKNDILNSIPRIENINLALANPKTLEIEIVEREPAGIYCLDLKSKTEGCYFIDKNGFIFSKAPSFSGDVYYLYSSNPPLDDPLGKYYLTTAEFQQLLPFVMTLKEINVPTRSLLSTSNEYYLELVGDGKIIINKEDDLKKVAENIESFLKDQDITKAANFLENVSYIDMRFGNKVFYKLKSDI
jgi:cell division septal protein FtsQ